MHGLTEIPKRFHYEIFFRNNEQRFEYTVELDPETLEHEAPPNAASRWTELAYKQCPHCPLKPEETPHCPLALRVSPLINVPKCKSYDPVRVVVTQEDKRISMETTAQEAFSSLLGLIMPTSGCPHTAFFKPMAWYHQPFAASDETLFRVCASYLMGSFLLQKELLTKAPLKKGQAPDLNVLKTVYDNMHTINVKLASRLTYDVQTDSTLNAIVLLDLLTKDLPMAIDEGLNELRCLFEKAGREPG